MSDPSLFDTWISQAGLNDLFNPQKTVTAMRDAMARMEELVEVAPPPVEAIHDIEIAGGSGARPARVYLPYGAQPDSGPGLIFYHGGGFMVGTLKSHDPLCRRLAAVSGVRICSIDYRLAPEHPFPAATDDAFAAMDAALAGDLEDYGFDANRLAVGGDSAGGNLAASVARERRDQLHYQLLLYPLMQLLQTKKDRPRWQEGPLLSEFTLDEIRKHYIASADPADVRISPLLADDLKGLPPAYILAAEMDPLLDEGAAYRDRLTASGVPVEYKLWKTVPHGFLNMSRLFPACISAIEASARSLSKTFEA
ncbi:alpha/beta hydrolase [Oceanicaulis alexandrii]|uniref:alpha/beta hydrolase n=1 Tax=Oceanicaulis alexandrii TaxID=153233 RepID=UPI0035CEA690